MRLAQFRLESLGLLLGSPRFLSLHQALPFQRRRLQLSHCRFPRLLRTHFVHGRVEPLNLLLCTRDVPRQCRPVSTQLALHGHDILLERTFRFEQLFVPLLQRLLRTRQLLIALLERLTQVLFRCLQLSLPHTGCLAKCLQLVVALLQHLLQ